MTAALQILFALLGSHFAVADTTPLRDTAVLSIRADRATYYRGERIRLHASVRNTGDAPLTAGFQLDPTLGQTVLWFRKPPAAFARLSCFVQSASFGYVRPRTLAPGEQHEQYLDIAVTALEAPLARFVLDQTGAYEFRMEFNDVPGDADGHLDSNVLSVDVVPAPGEEQAAQAAYTVDLAYIAQIANGSRAFLTANEVDAAARFVENYGSSRYAGPVKEGLLQWLEYRVRSQQASDGERALFEKLTRKDDNTPPELHVEASPAALWPPNHLLVRVLTALSVNDDMDPSPAVKLVSITCNDGCVPPDDISGAEPGTDDREFELRAERNGKGTGRTYTITYSATDASGNSTLASATVVVPHDLGK